LINAMLRLRPDRMKKLNIPIILFVAAIYLTLMSCTLPVADGKLSSDDCVDRLSEQVQSKPAQTHLETLDGQDVNLGDFFRLCLLHSPPCSLPDKFYYWKHEVKLVTSKTLDGPASHRIRIYYNYLSTCRPDLSDPQKTHGDIAEFYDKYGEFMGLAIYVGDGLYWPLPYSKYSGGRRYLRSY
jgi:hypothetical protein